MDTNNFVIVESPSKAVTIKKFLGDNYVVLASKGHIRDFPKYGIGVNVNDNFTPKYEIINKKLVNDFLKKIKDNSNVYLATDPDREGEAIAWHLSEVISQRNENVNFYRVEFHEIMESSIKKAFQSSRCIDHNLVKAQQTRKILDRIIGYRLCALLRSNIRRYNISAGRVQSIALKIICDRDEDIDKFIPVEYWIISIRFLIGKSLKFNVNLSLINDKKFNIETKEHANNIINDLNNIKKSFVEGSDIKIIKRNSFPPFITSSLQQAAHNLLGFPVKKTMIVAQQLYEGILIQDGFMGLITYMRTDSFNISNEAKKLCKDFIINKYGNEYAPSSYNFYKNKSNSEGAHEAIRPTNINLFPRDTKQYLTKDQYLLYEMIWNRFIASQMTPSMSKRITINICVSSELEKYLFKFSHSKLIFDGFTKVLKSNIDEEGNEDKNNIIDDTIFDVKENVLCNVIDIKKESKFTKPPVRYNEASLVKEMEDNGIGRPSTYSSMVNIIKTRKYVTKIKNKFISTELGKKVNNYLVEKLPDLINIDFTASMEEKLDKIASEKLFWVDVLDNFYSLFLKWYENAKYDTSINNEVVKEIFLSLDKIESWEEPTKKGKRIYNDKKFFESIKTQYMEKGTVTKRQWDYIIIMSFKYLENSEDFIRIIKKYNLKNELKEKELNI